MERRCFVTILNPSAPRLKRLQRNPILETPAEPEKISMLRKALEETHLEVEILSTEAEKDLSIKEVVIKENTEEEKTKLEPREQFLEGNNVSGVIKEEVDAELKEDSRPYHAKLVPIPKIYEPTPKIDVERLVKTGVLKRIHDY